MWHTATEQSKSSTSDKARHHVMTRQTLLSNRSCSSSVTIVSIIPLRQRLKVRSVISLLKTLAENATSKVTTDDVIF